MAVHIAGVEEPLASDERIMAQYCTRCGRRLTREYQRFPIGARVEVTDSYTTIVLGGEPDCQGLRLPSAPPTK